MGRWKLFYENPKVIRDTLNEATDVADHIHELERELIRQLVAIDKKRYFVRYGFRTLGGFCRHWLKFSRTQAQRIVNQVRRYDPSKDKIAKHPNNTIAGNDANNSKESKNSKDAQRVQPTDQFVDGVYDGVYVHGSEVLRGDGESDDET